ncbi:MAG: PAS domain S-box protein, partial [Acidobacteriota bacterium]
MHHHSQPPAHKTNSSPPKGGSFGIGTRLFGLLLLVLVPLFLVQTFIQHDRYQGRIELLRKASVDIARHQALLLERFVEDLYHRERLVGLALAALQPSDLERMRQMLEACRMEYPALRELAWVNPRGRVIASAQSGFLADDIGGMPYFLNIASGNTRVMSSLFHSSATGEEAFTISRVVSGGDGEAQGVIVAVIAPEMLDDVSPFEQESNLRGCIVDGNGVAVHCYPSMESFREGALLDENGWIDSVAPVSSTSWTVQVGFKRAEAMQPVVDKLIFQFGIFFTVALAAALLAIYLSKRITGPIARLREESLSLGHGKLGSPVSVEGPGELRDLARAFNAMSEMVRAREDDLFRMQDDLETRVRERTAELESALDALRSNQEMLESVVETVDSLIVLIGPDGKIRLFNRACEELTGYGRAEAIGRSVEELFIPAEWMSIPEKSFFALSSSEPRRPRSIPWLTRSGERKTIEWRCTAASLTKDGRAFVLGAGIDVTARTVAEEAIQERDRLNRLLLDSLPQPAMLIRKDRTILAANRTAKQAGATVGGYCWKVFGRGDYIAEEHKHILSEPKALPLPCAVKCAFCMADESLAEGEAMNAPEVHAFGRIWDTWWIPIDGDVYFHYAIDITERKGAEEVF